LDILRNHIATESVDLIYLDPPFNSNKNYNILFKSPQGVQSDAQITAFDDTWHWSTAHGSQAEREYSEILHQSNTDTAEVITAFRKMLGENDVMAYLVMMTNRLIELHRVLRPTGSLYLHCDPTASHYLKIILDSVFGGVNFENEVVWWYRKWSASETRFLRNHDIIFFYSKGKKHTFNVQYVPLAPSTLKRFGGKRQDFADETRTRKITTDEESLGSYMPDVWPINLLPAASAERLGYPTQKPLALLERIIRASSREGDVVLDPFCGCGTAIHAAQILKRQWIGIDITHLAITLVEKRLRDAFPGIVYDVQGTPKDLDGARDLALRDKYQFQWWACSLVNAQPYQGKKKGADSGIDGLIYFQDDTSGAKKIIVSVKGGENVGRVMIADLKNSVQRENAQIGLFITLNEPTGPMRDEAASAGFYVSPANNQQYPKIQIITIARLLDGTQRPMYLDLSQGGLTFKQAPKAKERKEDEQPGFGI
jgi:site-specific DNA-methyltransferase (adenine-specific)